MKIGILVNRNDRSGGFRVIHEIANRISSSECEVIMIFRPNEPTVEYGERKYNRVIFKRKSNKISVINKIADYLSYLPKIPECDILISTFYVTSIVAYIYKLKNRRVKVFSLIQGLEGYFTGGINKFIALITYQFKFTYIVNSRWMYEQLKKRQLLTRRIIAIKLGLSDEYLLDKNYIVKRSNDINIIGIIGRKMGIKGLDLFWEMVRRIKSPKIEYIIASNEEVIIPEDIKACIKRINASNDNEMVSFYNSIDLFLSTSIMESFSFPPLEAMSQAKPVVMINNGGCMDYALDGYNCVLIEKTNSAELHTYIMDIINNNDKRQRISKNGLNTAKKFVWDSAIITLNKEFNLL